VFLADVPTRSIEDFAVRSFSKKRTLVAIGFGFVLAGTLTAGVIGGTTSQGGPPPPDNLIGSHSIPWISIPFR
jgi:hypothetical protein